MLKMYFYGLHGKKIEIVEAANEPVFGLLGDVVQLGEAAKGTYDAARLARATLTFFASPEGEGTLRKKAPPRPPSVYRDGRTSLLRCFYREVVVRFKPDVPEETRRAHLADFGLQTMRGNPFIPDQVVVRDPKDSRRGDDLIEVANQLAQRDGDIILAAPNFVSEFKRTALPIIPVSQWHLENTAHFPGQKSGEDVRAQQAWGIAMGSREIIVAVLDDGVDIDHPALKDAIWHNPDGTSPDKFGRDFFLDQADPGHFDPRPKVFAAPFNQKAGNDIHGTPCAGLVAAVASDGRAFGVAAGCRILAVKIFHADAFASDDRVGTAIQYAAGIADILSLSWTAPESPLIESPINDAAANGRNRKGSAVFCATGNDSAPFVGFPATVGAAVAVGASTDDGLHALYSNSGPEVALVAPSSGGRQAIFTCDVSLTNRGFNLGSDADGGADGLYTNAFGGTSASTPIAAGAAAVVLSQNPALTASEVKQQLQQTADNIGTDTNLFGSGRVNLFRALGGKP
jgi:subtilisin family serine protease